MGSVPLGTIRPPDRTHILSMPSVTWLCSFRLCSSREPSFVFKDRLAVRVPPGTGEQGRQVMLQAGLRPVAVRTGRGLGQVGPLGGHKKLAREDMIRGLCGFRPAAIHACLVFEFFTLFAHALPRI